MVLLAFVGVIALWGIWAELASRPASVPLIGEVAPAFSAPLLNADDTTYGFPNGSSTLITFWATWCRGCKTAIGQAKQIQAALGKDRIAIVTVSIDTKSRRSKASETADSIGGEIVWLFDDGQRIYRAYGNSALGETYAVDRAQVLRAKFFGPTLSVDRIGAAFSSEAVSGRTQ